MSLSIPYRSVDMDIKRTIVKDLTFVREDKYTKRTSTLYGFDSDDKFIYIPYSYMRQKYVDKLNKISYKKANIVFSATLRQVQEEIKPKIFDMLNDKGCCVISMGCGLGKTILSIYIASVLKLKTIILLFNKLMLVDQWTESIKKVTKSNVQFLKPGCTIDMDNDFFIVNAQNVPKFGRLQQFGLCICDECHLAITPVGLVALQHIVPKYLVGLSATPFRLDGMNDFLKAYFGEPITKTYTRNHKVYFVDTGIKLDYKYTFDGKIDWNSVLNTQALNVDRNLVIVKLVRKFSQRNFLILTRRVEQAHYLVNTLKAKGENVDILTGAKRKYDINARILVATSAKCSIGFDHPTMDTLVLAGDAEAYFEQFLGRIIARAPVEPWVFDFVDASPGVLKKHFSTRKKVYLRFGGEICYTL
jgi:superfamily II DNA or RNA helicase